ncbi:MAG: sigma-70 family RNA polymerase sigma factor [Armatimonadetes bacterium]|nr:sigma-70 family RNA polymerase sigma factor [Armatimonadota bacterium]
MTNAVSILSDESPAVLSLSAADWLCRLVQKPRPAPVQPAYLALARTGNTDALALLYDEYREPVWRLCRRLLRSEADAQDVLQSTFVKAFAALPRFRGDASLKTWLLRIAVNEANTVGRRRDVITATEETPLPDAPTGLDDAERVAVRSLVDALKPEFRTVIVLRFWEELSYEEMGTVLNMPLPGVKMRLHRAKEAFRKMYGEEITG